MAMFQMCKKKDKKKNVINTPCIHLPAFLASLLLFDHHRSICLLILTIPLRGDKSREVPLASQPSSQGEGVGGMVSAFLLQTVKATTPFIPPVATSCLPGSMSDSSLPTPFLELLVMGLPRAGFVSPFIHSNGKDRVPSPGSQQRVSSPEPLQNGRNFKEPWKHVEKLVKNAYS